MADLPFTTAHTPAHQAHVDDLFSRVLTVIVAVSLVTMVVFGAAAVFANLGTAKTGQVFAEIAFGALVFAAISGLIEKKRTTGHI